MVICTLVIGWGADCACERSVNGSTIPQNREASMSKAIRRGLILVVSWALFSAAAMAKTGMNNADHHKHKAGVHHSRFSKLAFWRHHKDGEKNVKSAQTNHPQPKHTPVKAAQRKAVSSTVAAGKK